MDHSMFAFTAVAMLAATLAIGHGAAAQSPSVEGCYRADRPLGTSAGSAYGRVVPGEAGRRIGEDSVALPSHLPPASRRSRRASRNGDGQVVGRREQVGRHR